MRSDLVAYGTESLVLTVADTGAGISSEVKRKLFDAFFTTKGIGGTGLGLWVSKEIVDRHHGALKVRSSQMKGKAGTVLTLFLPFEAAKSLDLSQVSPVRRSAAAETADRPTLASGQDVQMY